MIPTFSRTQVERFESFKNKCLTFSFISFWHLHTEVDDDVVQSVKFTFLKPLHMFSQAIEMCYNLNIKN